MDDLLNIGLMAKRSGLSTRALRLYDAIGLLRPVDVDPVTGYRRYSEDQVAHAVLIARLREAEVPLPEVAAVLAEPDGTARRGRLDRWWLGREHHIERQRDLIAALGRHMEEEDIMIPTTTHRLDAGALAAALGAVLRCTSDDASTPVIGGVLLEPAADGVRLVATDKFRLAVWDLPAHSDGGLPVLLDAEALEAMLVGLGDAGTVAIEVSEDAVTFRHATENVSVPLVPGVYPEYRRLLDASVAIGVITVDRVAIESALVAACTDAPNGEAVRLEPVDGALRLSSTAGAVDVAATWTGEPSPMALNAEYALDGVRSFPGASTIEIEIAGPMHPVSFRADGYQAQYLLMPIRLDNPVPTG